MAAEKYDVIVVGAGIAGLYAAYVLQEEHSKKVLVLEAKDRIGGRVFATKIKSANGTDVWDLGGQWVGRTQKYLLDALSEFGLQKYEQFSTGKKKLVLRDLTDIRSYSGLIPTLGPLELLEVNNLLGRITKMSDSINIENVSQHPNALEWDSMTLHSYVVENCKYEATKEIFEAAIRTILGIDLSQTSLLFFLFYCKQGGNFETIAESKNGGAQEFRVKGSMYQLAQKLAERLCEVMTGEPVHSVTQAVESIEVTTKTGKRFYCDDIIIAIPPHLVNNIQFEPKLPNDRLRLGEQMCPGHMIKFIVTYKTTFWKENGLSGEITATTLSGGTGPISITFDATTADESPALVGFICAEHAMYWMEKTMEERREAVLHALSETLGREALHPIDYIDKDWSKEPYNGGCPVGVCSPRTLLYFHHALTQPFGRVHWAGTETAQVWCGYIDGALESATRAVDEIIEDDPKSPDEWNGSPMFSKYMKYKSRVREKTPSLAFTIVKTAICTALIGILGYFAFNEVKGRMF